MLRWVIPVCVAMPLATEEGQEEIAWATDHLSEHYHHINNYRLGGGATTVDQPD